MAGSSPRVGTAIGVRYRRYPLIQKLDTSCRIVSSGGRSSAQFAAKGLPSSESKTLGGSFED